VGLDPGLKPSRVGPRSSLGSPADPKGDRGADSRGRNRLATGLDRPLDREATQEPTNDRSEPEVYGQVPRFVSSDLSASHLIRGFAHVACPCRPTVDTGASRRVSRACCGRNATAGREYGSREAQEGSAEGPRVVVSTASLGEGHSLGPPAYPVVSEPVRPQDGSVRILHTTPEGGRPGAAYSLDVIISVGYRVKSKRGTQRPHSRLSSAASPRCPSLRSSVDTGAPPTGPLWHGGPMGNCRSTVKRPSRRSRRSPRQSSRARRSGRPCR
jgi:hypothetical protein